MARIVRKEVRPVQALEKPPMVFPILHQNTSAEPLRSLLEEARRLEANPKVLFANIAAGFPYADVPEMGPSVVVVTDGDQELARSAAKRLAGQMWSLRHGLETRLPDAAEAVRLAMESAERPVVLVEMGDNVGGGSAADGTWILQELLRQGAERFVVVICDPAAVRECVQAGARQTVDLLVGGKTDDLHGQPVRLRGRVRSVHDGLYEETEVRHGGKRFNDQGLTAVVELESKSLVVLNSLRDPPFSLQQLLSLGIAPERQRILVVKAAIAYRAAYEPVARRIIEVDTPGTTTPNPKRLRYKNIRRPMFPLDAEEWSAPYG
jgi:microcystin degradation protein MlrC